MISSNWKTLNGKVSLHYTWMQAANCRRVHVFWKGIFGSVLSRTARLSFHISQMIGCSITTVPVLISDPGGCFVSNELRECARVRGIGLLTAPGEFHGLTADLENLIRVIKRLARKFADDHPELILASCVSLACSSRNNGFKTGGYSPVQWAFGADNEGHGVAATMSSEVETSGTWNLGHVFSSWQSDSRSGWPSIQVYGWDPLVSS